MATATKTKAPTKKAPVAKPAPAPVKVPTQAGAKAVPLKSDKHIGVITAALGKSLANTEEIDSHSWLWVKTPDAAQVIETLGSWSTEHSKIIYDARLAVATLVAVRRAFPKVADPKTSLTSVAVTALNDGLADGSVKDWDVSIKIDGTLRLTMTPAKGKVVEGGARDIAKALGVSRPKADGASGAKSEPERDPDTGLTLSSKAKLDKVNALKAEGKAVREWKAGGEVGPRPATPVTDKADQERADDAARRQATKDADAALADSHKAKQADKRKGKPKAAPTPGETSSAVKAEAEAEDQPATLQASDGSTVKPEHVIDAVPVPRGGGQPPIDRTTVTPRPKSATAGRSRSATAKAS